MLHLTNNAEETHPGESYSWSKAFWTLVFFYVSEPLR